jgi:outer membrane receptor protein involved in Fe transport
MSTYRVTPHLCSLWLYWAACAAPPEVVAAETMAAMESAKVRYDIPAQPLVDALTQFGVQSRRQLMFDPDAIPARMVPAVQGVYTAREALNILISDSGLTYSVDDKNTIIVRRAARISSAPAISTSAAWAQSTAESERDRAPEAESSRLNEQIAEVQELIVTGSHIRGAQSASPVQSYDREFIERTGVATTRDFIRTLPQNFNGGLSETNASFSPANEAGLNVNLGSGVNLRGQGTDATLVLLDGRRLSAAGVGQFVDVSMIPLTAIKRVDVLTDGASAIYGADAVGGVVNFVLRDDYDGAETQVRWGTVTAGDNVEKSVGQTFGRNWGSGRALLSYEYYARDPLDSSDRGFTAGVVDPTWLLPEQRRHSVFLTGRQDLGANVGLFGTGFYSTREHRTFVGSNATTTVSSSAGELEQYGAVVGTKVDLARGWQADIAATMSRSETDSVSRRYNLPLSPSDPGLPEGSSITRTDLMAFDAKVDGDLFPVGGGQARAALGAQWRGESFEDDSALAYDDSRSVRAVFGELYVPFVSAANARSGVQRLELTLAGRYERYSDFGSSTTPKLGLLWAPLESLVLRSTFGKSFRAPQLRELSEANVQGILVDAPDPSAPGGTRLTMIGFGNNASLQAESAKTWTAGFDVQPAGLPGLTVGVTYFDIAFKDKIESVLTLFEVFTDPRYASLITYDPPPELIAYYNSRRFPVLNLTATQAPPEQAEAYFDARLRNLATVDTRGLDVNVSYAVDTAIGMFDLRLDGTYLFDKIQQLLPSDRPRDLVDTQYNPAALKLRGGLGWSSDKGWSASLFMNYVGDYADDRVLPEVKVDDWLTLDLQLAYAYPGTTGFLQGTRCSLSVLNVTDRDPPFVASSYNENINFDPDNASALGRFIALQLTKSW